MFGWAADCNVNHISLSNLGLSYRSGHVAYESRKRGFLLHLVLFSSAALAIFIAYGALVGGATAGTTWMVMTQGNLMAGTTVALPLTALSPIATLSLTCSSITDAGE